MSKNKANSMSARAPRASDGQALIFFGARAELFGSDLFFLEPEPNVLALIIIFWSQSRAFWLWIFILEPVTELEVLGAS